MSNRKIIAVILIPIVLVSLFVGWLYLRYSGYATLSVNLYEDSGHWVRDYATDLPQYFTMISYSISNLGTISASDIQYTIYVDGDIKLQNTISTLASDASFTNQFSIVVKYDDRCRISLTASCDDSSDTYDYNFKATLPRSWSSSEIMKLFITPNNQVVESLVKEIQEAKFFLIPDWIAIRDWVGNNIEYVHDINAHDSAEYWQLPTETLSYKAGDCEDFSILLCSLYRAVGWDEDDVYVVVGEKDGDYHAWVKLNVWLIGWQNIEPQANGWNTIIGDFFSLSGYRAESNFNDVHSFDV